MAYYTAVSMTFYTFFVVLFVLIARYLEMRIFKNEFRTLKVAWPCEQCPVGIEYVFYICLLEILRMCESPLFLKNQNSDLLFIYDTLYVMIINV